MNGVACDVFSFLSFCSLWLVTTEAKVFQTVRHTQLSDTEVIVTWELAPGQTLTWDYRVSYTYRLAQVGDCQPVLRATQLSRQLGPRVRSLRLPGLLPWRTYRYKLKAPSAYFVQEDIVTGTFSTRPTETAGSPVQNVEVHNITPTSADISWREPPCVLRNGALRRFDVQLTGPDPPIILNAYTGLYVTISNLMPTTPYLVRVRYVNSVGPGRFTEPLHFVTAGGGGGDLQNSASFTRQVDRWATVSLMGKVPGVLASLPGGTLSPKPTPPSLLPRQEGRPRPLPQALRAQQSASSNSFEQLSQSRSPPWMPSRNSLGWPSSPLDQQPPSETFPARWQQQEKQQQQLLLPALSQSSSPGLGHPQPPPSLPSQSATHPSPLSPNQSKLGVDGSPPPLPPPSHRTGTVQGRHLQLGSTVPTAASEAITGALPGSLPRSSRSICGNADNPCAPYDLKQTGKDLRCVNVSWKVNDALRVITAFDVFDCTDTTDTNVLDHRVTSPPGKAREVTLCGLQPGKFYTYGVRARASPTAFSGLITIRVHTSHLAPPTPLRPELQGLSMTSAQIGIRGVESANGPVTSYYVIVGLAPLTEEERVDAGIASAPRGFWRGKPALTPYGAQTDLGLFQNQKGTPEENYLKSAEDSNPTENRQIARLAKIPPAEAQQTGKMAEDRNFVRRKVDPAASFLLENRVKNSAHPKQRVRSEEDGYINSAKSRVQPDTTSLQQGKTYSQPDTNRLQQEKAYSQPDTTRLQQEKTYSQPDTTRLQQEKTYSQPDTTRLQQGKAYSQPDTTRLQQEKTYSQPDTTRLQQGKAYSQPDATRLQQGKAYSQPDATRLQQGKAYSQPETIGFQQGKAYGQADATKSMFDTRGKVGDAEKRLVVEAILGKYDGTKPQEEWTGNDAVRDGRDGSVLLTSRTAQHEVSLSPPPSLPLPAASILMPEARDRGRSSLPYLTVRHSVDRPSYDIQNLLTDSSRAPAAEFAVQQQTLAQSLYPTANISGPARGTIIEPEQSNPVTISADVNLLKKKSGVVPKALMKPILIVKKTKHSIQANDSPQDVLRRPTGKLLKGNNSGFSTTTASIFGKASAPLNISFKRVAPFAKTEDSAETTPNGMSSDMTELRTRVVKSKTIVRKTGGNTYYTDDQEWMSRSLQGHMDAVGLTGSDRNTSTQNQLSDRYAQNTDHATSVHHDKAESIDLPIVAENSTDSRALFTATSLTRKLMPNTTKNNFTESMMTEVSDELRRKLESLKGNITETKPHIITKSAPMMKIQTNSVVSVSSAQEDLNSRPIGIISDPWKIERAESAVNVETRASRNDSPYNTEVITIRMETTRNADGVMDISRTQTWKATESKMISSSRPFGGVNQTANNDRPRNTAMLAHNTLLLTDTTHTTETITTGTHHVDKTSTAKQLFVEKSYTSLSKPMSGSKGLNEGTDALRSVSGFKNHAFVLVESTMAVTLDNQNPGPISNAIQIGPKTGSLAQIVDTTETVSDSEKENSHPSDITAKDWFGYPSENRQKAAVWINNESLGTIVQHSAGEAKRRGLETLHYRASSDDGHSRGWPQMAQMELRRQKRQENDQSLPAGQIMAELKDVDILGKWFTVGDGNTYGGFTNSPLRADGRYRVYLVAISQVESVKFAVSPPLVISMPREPTVQRGFEWQRRDNAIVMGVMMALSVCVLIAMLWLKCLLYRTDQPDAGGCIQLRVPKKFFIWEDGAPLSLWRTDTGTREPFRLAGDQQCVTDERHWTVIYALSEPRSIITCRKLLPPQSMVPSPNPDRPVGSEPVTFRKEFQALPRPNPSNSTLAGRRQHDLNNTPSILPFDATRVILDHDGTGRGDYINASFITGYMDDNGKRSSYITAQCPFDDSTALDMWRTVYQHGVGTLVLLARVIEDGSMRCIQFWPEIGKTQHGPFLIKVMDQFTYAHYTERLMSVRKRNRKEEELLVRLFCFTSWPEKGVPQDAIPFVELCTRVHKSDGGSDSPMMVLCETGSGRSAVFIATDILLAQYATESQASVYDVVCALRSERAFMVQTFPQYAFLYEAVLEEMHAGDTWISASDLRDRYRQLTRHNPLTGRTYLRDQFILLEIMLNKQASDVQSESSPPRAGIPQRHNYGAQPDVIPARRPSFSVPRANNNNNTNNTNCSSNVDHWPTETENVEDDAVSDDLGLEDLVQVDGYRRKNQFLLMKTPTLAGVQQLWQHVYTRDVRSIVVMEDPDCPAVGQYWPTLGCRVWEPFLVELLETGSEEGISVRTFRLVHTHRTKDEPKLVRQFQFHGWCPDPVNTFQQQQQRRGGGGGVSYGRYNSSTPIPNDSQPDNNGYRGNRRSQCCPPPSARASLLALYSMVGKWQDHVSVDSTPILVHCRDGVVCSGLYVALSLVLARLQEENLVSVYRVCRALRKQCPNAISNFDQYRFLYKVLWDYINVNCAEGCALDRPWICLDSPDPGYGVVPGRSLQESERYPAEESRPVYHTPGLFFDESGFPAEAHDPEYYQYGDEPAEPPETEEEGEGDADEPDDYTPGTVSGRYRTGYPLHTPPAPKSAGQRGRANHNHQDRSAASGGCHHAYRFTPHALFPASDRPPRQDRAEEGQTRTTAGQPSYSPRRTPTPNTTTPSPATRTSRSPYLRGTSPRRCGLQSNRPRSSRAQPQPSPVLPSPAPMRARGGRPHSLSPSSLTQSAPTSGWLSSATDPGKVRSQTVLKETTEMVDDGGVFFRQEVTDTVQELSTTTTTTSSTTRSESDS